MLYRESFSIPFLYLSILISSLAFGADPQKNADQLIREANGKWTAQLPNGDSTELVGLDKARDILDKLDGLNRRYGTPNQTPANTPSNMAKPGGAPRVDMGGLANLVIDLGTKSEKAKAREHAEWLAERARENRTPIPGKQPTGEYAEHQFLNNAPQPKDDLSNFKYPDHFFPSSSSSTYSGPTPVADLKGTEVPNITNVKEMIEQTKKAMALNGKLNKDPFTILPQSPLPSLSDTPKSGGGLLQGLAGAGATAATLAGAGGTVAAGGGAAGGTVAAGGGGLGATIYGGLIAAAPWVAVVGGSVALGVAIGKAIRYVYPVKKYEPVANIPNPHREIIERHRQERAARMAELDRLDESFSRLKASCEANKLEVYSQDKAEQWFESIRQSLKNDKPVANIPQRSQNSSSSNTPSSPSPKKPEDEKKSRKSLIEQTRSLTNKEARELVKDNLPGYVEKKDPPFKTQGNTAFYNQKTKTWISADQDCHNGGVWKIFDRAGKREGTYDSLLTKRIKD